VGAYVAEKGQQSQSQKDCCLKRGSRQKHEGGVGEYEGKEVKS
jgi:hypothetical protein